MTGWKERLGAFDGLAPEDAVFRRAQEGPRHEPPTDGPSEAKRLTAGVTAFVVFAAAAVFVWQAFQPSANEPTIGDPTETPNASVLTATLSAEDGWPTGTLTYGGASRTYEPEGFCPNDADCSRVVKAPIPADYLPVPLDTALAFEGSLRPVSAVLTLQSHSVSGYRDFGSRELKIADGTAEISLPTDNPPDAYLLDIRASGDDGYTHFYFGLSVDDGTTEGVIVTLSATGREPAAELTYREGAQEGLLEVSCDAEDRCERTEFDPAYPPDLRPVAAPRGIPVSFAGDGTVERLVIRRYGGDPSSANVVADTDGVGVTLPQSPGDYLLWIAVDLDEGGSATFYFRVSVAIAETCDLPAVQPASLPWLAQGEPLPEPIVMEQYRKFLWLGPEGTDWEDSYVGMRLLEDPVDVAGDESPQLPDGTSGTIVVPNDQEWIIFWRESSNYCGTIALYVYLHNLSRAESRTQTIALAGSFEQSSI